MPTLQPFWQAHDTSPNSSKPIAQPSLSSPSPPSQPSLSSPLLPSPRELLQLLCAAPHLLFLIGAWLELMRQVTRLLGELTPLAAFLKLDLIFIGLAVSVPFISFFLIIGFGRYEGPRVWFFSLVFWALIALKLMPYELLKVPFFAPTISSGSMSEQSPAPSKPSKPHFLVYPLHPKAP